MKKITLYVENGSYLTKLHPFTKLIYILMGIMVPVLCGNLMIYAAMIGISCIILLSGGLMKKAVPLVMFSFTIIGVIFLIQGMFYYKNSMPMFSVGPCIFYKEGVYHATRIGLNILNMLLSFATFVLSTKPQDLVEELEKKGFSKRFGYIINSVFQIIPQMMGTMNTITDAQKSRGMETEGNIFVRAKAFIPLISPVVMSSLVNTRERAIALEVRGFDSDIKKTYLKNFEKSRLDGIITMICFCLLALALVYRIGLMLKIWGI